MTEVKTRSDQPSSMAERIAKRLRNSGEGAGPDITTKTGDSALVRLPMLSSTAGIVKDSLGRSLGRREEWFSCDERQRNRRTTRRTRQA